MKDFKKFGAEGEGEASAFLQRHGYRILETNFRTKTSEVDIIARQGEVYCFVEVKSRRSARFGSALETVKTSKQRQIARAALQYIQRHKLFKQPVRFDVVIVTRDPAGHSRLELIPDAFETDIRYAY